MRVATLLLLLVLALPALGQDAQVVLDPQTAEPVPLGLTAPPTDLPREASTDALNLLVHLPEGATKVVRFLPGEPHAALIQNGAAVVAFTWALPTRTGHGHDNAVELDRHVYEFQPSDIFVDGSGRAYVALRQGGLHILDAFIPTDLLPRGETVEFDAIAVVVQDDVAYVGAGFAGLRIFDVDNADFPAQLGSVTTGGSANGLHIEGDLLFVANGNPSGVDNFLIYDVAEPASPQLVGSFNPDGFVTNVAVQDEVAYLSGAFGLLALDVSDPTSPAVISSFEAGGQTTYEVAIHEDRLAVSGLAGLFVLDISDPANLELIDSTPAGQGLSTDIARVAGFDLALLGDRFRGAEVLHFHEGAYNLMSFYRNGGFAHKAAFVGNRLYVTDLNGALRIFNLDDVQAGVAFQISRLGLPPNTQWVLVHDGLAYVADADFGPSGLTIADVGISAAPAIVGSLATESQAFGLDLAGDVLFLANGFGGLTAVDVSDAEEPVAIGSLPIGSNVVDVAVHDDVAFVVSFGGGMLAVDVSDPANLETISTQAWGFLNAIALEHELALLPREHAYVADGQEGLRVVDIADPDDLVTVATLPTSTQARDVAAGIRWDVATNTPVAHVADDFFGLRVFGVDQNEEIASFRSADRGIGVAARVDPELNLIALAAGEVGVYVFSGPFQVSGEAEPTAGALALDAVFPNPVRGEATVTFRLADAGNAELELFDVLGRRLTHLASGAHGAGTHEVSFDASSFASGLYVVRLSAAGETATRRMTVVR